jgi:hypothetical protein
MFADGQIRYVKKLGLLRSCLFGVDLLEYAIEITKLRCWLSLIVEQRVDLDQKENNYNLKPLPNLEFKFYKKLIFSKSPKLVQYRPNKEKIFSLLKKNHLSLLKAKSCQFLLHNRSS